MNYLPIVKQLKKLSPQAIILFGSHALRTAHSDSDIDFLVLKNTDASLHKRITDAHRVLNTSLPVDILVLTPAEFKKYKQMNSFYRTISETGKVLYGRV